MQQPNFRNQESEKGPRVGVHYIREWQDRDAVKMEEGKGGRTLIGMGTGRAMQGLYKLPRGKSKPKQSVLLLSYKTTTQMTWQDIINDATMSPLACGKQPSSCD